MKYTCKIFNEADKKILDELCSKLTEEQLTAIAHLELDQQNAGKFFGTVNTLKYLAGGMVLCVGAYCVVNGVIGVKRIINDRKTKKQIEKNLDVMIKTTAEDFKEV